MTESRWVELYWRRRALLEKKFSKGEFYATNETEEAELRSITDELQRESGSIDGYYPPFLMGSTSEA